MMIKTGGSDHMLMLGRFLMNIKKKHLSGKVIPYYAINPELWSNPYPLSFSRFGTSQSQA